MSVYVDELTVWPNAHGMAADTLDELHAMAFKIGMRREWFQPGRGRHPHYDLVKSRRDKAVALGAIEVSGRDLIMLWRAQREVVT